MTVEYEVRPIGQHTPRVCWIACYRMLYAWKKQPDRLCYDRLVKSRIPMDQGLDIEHWPKARNAMRLTSFRVEYLSDFDNLYHVLKTYGPMWCAGDFSNRSGHAILLTGAYETNKRLRMIDPWQVHKGTNTEMRDFEWWKDNIKDAHAACQTWY